MLIAYVHYLQQTDTGLNHVRQFAEAARHLGHDVAVHAMNIGPDGPPSSASSLRLRQALKTYLRRYLHEPRELIWNVLYVGREAKILRSARPDVMLVRDHCLGASCVPVAHWLGLPLVLEVNAPAAETLLYEDEYWHVPGMAAWLESWKLRHAAAVTVVSSSLRDYLVRCYGIPASKLTVVPNGSDITLFRPDVKPDPELRTLVGEGPVIGFVGSFQKWHGTGLLARMIFEVGRARPHTRFVLVGDGPEAAVVRLAVSALDGRAFFLGWVPHARVPGVVATFDIGVMPESNFYGSPLKVIEWMAAGKAIVAPAYGPLRDVIDDGLQGLLFPPGDTHALISAVLRLVDDADLRRALGRAAAARARASLSWGENARRIAAVCKQVLRQLEWPQAVA